jgi:hypothetical protein
MSSSDWEKDLEEWRKSYKKYKSIQKRHDDIIQRREEETEILQKKLRQEAGIFYKRQQELNREDFNSLQLKKYKPWFMELLKDVPFIKENNTEIESLTDVYLHTYSRGTKSANEVIQFKFGEELVDIQPSLIVVTPPKKSEILEYVVSDSLQLKKRARKEDYATTKEREENGPTFEAEFFGNFSTQQLVREVEASSSRVPGGGCDVCGYVFARPTQPKYFPVLSTDDYNFWCCNLCKDVFYRYRYSKKIEKHAPTRAKLLPMGVQSLKL